MDSLKVSLSFVLIVVFSLTILSGCSIPSGYKSQTFPKPAEPSFEPKLPDNYFPLDDSAERAFSDKVSGLIKKRDFKALEAFGSDLIKGKERFNGGGWKIFSFDKLVSAPLTNDRNGWESQIRFLQNWTEKLPKSVLARTALANAYIGYAWEARGDGYANTVTPANHQIFEKRLERAEAAAADASHLEARYTGYYNVLLLLGTARGWDRPTFDSVFKEAIRFEPRYQYFYTNKAVYLLPRWSGQPGEWEDFADKVKADLGEAEGPKMYFLIVAEIERYHGRNFFETNRVSWEDTKKGFDLYAKEFGVNRRKLNQFAQLAFHAKDSQVSCDVFRHLQGQDDFEPEVWNNRKVFEFYRNVSINTYCDIPKIDNQAK